MSYSLENVDFSQALKALKNGHTVARSGWNGLGLFCFLVGGSIFNVNRPPLLGIYEEGTQIKYLPHIDLKTADGSIVTWLPSQTDIFANDWTISQKRNLIDFNLDFISLISGRSFSSAFIHLLENPNGKIRRSGWNGKDMYISAEEPIEVMLDGFEEGPSISEPWLAIHYPENHKLYPNGVVPWLASQSDLLANDWVLI